MKIRDASDQIELEVGMKLTSGGEVGAILRQGDEEGGPPEVLIVFPPDAGAVSATTERWACHARDYAAEGPDTPENWVCGEAELTPTELLLRLLIEEIGSGMSGRINRGGHGKHTGYLTVQRSNGPEGVVSRLKVRDSRKAGGRQYDPVFDRHMRDDGFPRLELRDEATGRYFPAVDYVTPPPVIQITREKVRGGMHTGRPYEKWIYYATGPDERKFDNDSIVTLRSHLKGIYRRVVLIEEWTK